MLLLCIFPSLATSQTYDRNNISLWLQEGNWDKIITSAQRTPDADTFLLKSAGYAAYQSGDRVAATDFFDRVLAVDSNNRPALYYSGLMLKSDEQYTAAIPLLRRLCNLVPDVSQYQVLLADCYAAKNERTAALRHLKAAKALSPASPSIANKLANAWIRLKTWDSAGSVLNQAMKEHPRDPSLIATAITLAYNAKQYNKVAALADSLIVTGRLKQESLIAALYADITAKNYTHATRIGHLLIDLGGESEEVLYYTAAAHQQLEEWAPADTLLRKCVSNLVKPNLEVYYLAEAEGAAKLKDWARSKALYDTAYFLFKNPQTLYLKGIMLQQAGRKTEAASVFKKYLALPKARQDTAIAQYLQHVIQN